MNSILKSLDPPKKQHLPEMVVSQIKRMILSNEIGVGQKLPSERELREHLGISRVVVREALKSLEQSGLVEIKHGSSGGAFVTYKIYKPFYNSLYDLFTEEKLTLNHFFEVRKEVECLSIRLAAKNARGKDIKKLQNNNKKLFSEIGNERDFVEIHMDFHVTIAELSGNPLIEMIVQSLGRLLNTILDTYNPRKSQTRAFHESIFQSHEKMISAITEKNIELCSKLMAIDTEFTLKLRINR
jgi:GntR family transcriptional repressor for pyruvate dehydrogenase complex